MTATEAIELMSKGVKMRHTYFSDDEWVYIGKDNQYVLEDGVECSEYEFWRWRKSEIYQTGWERFDKPSSGKGGTDE